jgi:putative mRNA 3-end processing factor
MLQGGPAMNYLKQIYKDAKSNVFLTGYQVEDTPGRILMETGKILIDGHNYDVRGKVEKFDFSAHASQQEMLRAIAKWGPEKVLLVHGDPEVIKVFKKKIEDETGIRVIVPEAGKKIELGD